MKKYKLQIIISLVLVSSFIILCIGSSFSLFNSYIKGQTKNKIVTGTYSMCEYENGTVWTFDYTGSEQDFIVPCNGEYKIELWGAQGIGDNGGLGGYVAGKIMLDESENFVVTVGKDGGNVDVRTDSSALSRIIVAGSGGGEFNYNECNHGSDIASGGNAGGLVGYNGASGSQGTAMIREAQGGSQTSGGLFGYGNEHQDIGKSGGFGYAGTASNITGSGGSGYYGGGSSGRSFCNGGSGGGGSSFISGHIGCDAISEDSTEDNIIHTGQANHYSGYVFTDTVMIDGSGYNWTTEKGEYVQMPTHDGSSIMVGNSGNGYAKITLVSADSPKIIYKEALLNGTDPVLESTATLAKTDSEIIRIASTENNTKLIPVIIGNDGSVTKADITKKWYSYADKEWANAVILKDEKVEYENGATIPESNIESYFVWIPRYKYKIFDEGNYTGITQIESKEQIIEIAFENKETTPSNGITKDSWLTHPAFTSFDSNGMWVGKFETGYDGATSTDSAQVNSVDTSKIIIKSNVYSWRSMTVGNMFKNSYDYIRELDSHMMKNTEWGAVAYLQHSNYGSATSVRVNNNSAYITGYSGTTEPTQGYNTNSVSENRFQSTSLEVDGTYTINYLNTSSVLSSTTGNYTGIYDMSGGCWEYVMDYTTGATTTGGLSGITNLYSNFFSNPTYTKYWDKYTSTIRTDFNNRILGDATGEMGPFGNTRDLDGNARPKSSWYKDVAYFAESSDPWFFRGGYWYDGAHAGNFAFSNNTGGADSRIGFRIVLTPQ